MKLLKNLRLRVVLIAAVSLAVVAAIGVGVANAQSPTSSRWVTTTVKTGNVTQTYLATGTITRSNTSKASFTVNGTVNAVKVGVGARVVAGQTLATLDTRALKLAVLEAETNLARAQLTLYTAQHPTTTSTKTSSPNAVSVDLSGLNQAVKRLSAATAAESTACDPITAWLDSTAATSSATPTATPSEPTSQQLATCATARAGREAATANLNSVMAKVNAVAGKTKSTSAPTQSGSSSGSSADSVASAKAAVLQAQQKLTSADSDLDDASLVAPITGTVGTVGLSAGDSSTAGSITIVGSGNAEVSIEVPLTTRSSLKVGSSATVTPAGSLTGLTGKVTNISLLQTSGTSGSTSTYTTTIVVVDPTQRLASGAKASVSIPLKASTGVLTVPASAATPTGTGTATVQVLASGATTPTTTQIKTGAVGGGMVEVTDGLSAGQVVVLADSSADIPSNATRSRTRTSSSSGSSTASAKTSATTPAAQPSAGR